MANGFGHLSVGTELTQTEFEQADTSHVFDSQATGDLGYASSAEVFRRLAIGSTGDLLIVAGGIPSWGTVFTANLTYNDNIEARFGTGGDSRIYYDGTDTFWDLRRAGTGDLMVALAGSFPSPDASTVHLFRGAAGSVSARGSAILVLEHSSSIEMHFKTPNSQAFNFQWGDPENSGAAFFGYDHSAPRFHWGFEGSNRLFYTANAFAFQEATTISVSTGIMAFDGVSGSAIRFNEAQANVDFVIEADGFDNLLHADASLGGITIGASHDAGFLFQVRGSHTLGVNGAAAMRIAPTLTMGSGENHYGLYIAASMVEHSSGTHAVVTALGVQPPNITDNAATTTTASTLHIFGAPTEGTNNYAIFVDSGSVRFDGSLWVESTPTEGSSGEQLTSGGSAAVMTWAAASSLRDYKHVHDPLAPQDALDRILGTTAYNFRYRDWTKAKGASRMVTTGDYRTEYAGVMADEMPEVMHHEGRIFSPVSAFGYTVAAFHAVQAQIDTLRGQLQTAGIIPEA